MKKNEKDAKVENLEKMNPFIFVKLSFGQHSVNLKFIFVPLQELLLQPNSNLSLNSPGSPLPY
jgi:hypothetical protein